MRVRGAQLISEERRRQVSVEGWTEEHDQIHCHGQLVMAAICYAHEAEQQAGNGDVLCGVPPVTDARLIWPWGSEWWKPGDDPVRCLVKAGALIAAEIDRLQALPNKVKG